MPKKDKVADSHKSTTKQLIHIIIVTLTTKNASFMKNASFASSKPDKYFFTNNNSIRTYQIL